MGPCRALIVDLAPKEQQNLGNALYSVWIAFGNIAGYLTGGAFTHSMRFLHF